MWQPTVLGGQCRLRFYERIGPALDDLALGIDGELRTLRVEDRLDELSLEPLADLEALAEQVNPPVGGDLPNEDHAARSNGERGKRDFESRWQLL